MNNLALKEPRSHFVYSGLSESKGIGAAWVEPVVTAAAIALPAIFGGGKKDAKARDQKRKALSQVGFNWLQTSGVPAGQEWNIDNWPDNSLNNIAKAYQQFGQIVADLHNQKVFNPGNTQNMQQIQQIIQQHGGGGGGNFLNAWGSQGSVSNAGFNYMPWLVGGGLFFLAAAGVSVLKSDSGKGKRK